MSTHEKRKANDSDFPQKKTKTEKEETPTPSYVKKLISQEPLPFGTDVLFLRFWLEAKSRLCWNSFPFFFTFSHEKHYKAYCNIIQNRVGDYLSKFVSACPKEAREKFLGLELCTDAMRFNTSHTQWQLSRNNVLPCSYEMLSDFLTNSFLESHPSARDNPLLVPVHVFRNAFSPRDMAFLILGKIVPNIGDFIRVNAGGSRCDTCTSNPEEISDSDHQFCFGIKRGGKLCNSVVCKSKVKKCCLCRSPIHEGGECGLLIKEKWVCSLCTKDVKKVVDEGK